MKEKNIMKSWKYVLTAAAILPASLWAATITGTIGAPAPGTPVLGAKVVLINQVGGAHVDSTTSAANGVYTFLNVANGAYAITASLSGYNSATSPTTAINPPGTQTVTVNISITKNNYTAVFTGMIRYAADSTPVINATVALTGGPIDPGANQTVHTDSTGAYRFDSVYAGTGYTITASKANYLNAVVSSQAVAWNSSSAVATLYLSQSLGTISGTIRRTDSTTKVIVGARIMIWQDTNLVDSAWTDSLGNYSDTLNAGTYTIKVSAATYKSNTGAATKDTAGVVILYGQNTVSNQNLTPARSGFTGNVHQQTATGAALAGAKVLLQRRTTTTAAYVTLDSTTTDANGAYTFAGDIAATGGAGGNYQLTISHAGYGTANNNSNPRLVSTLTAAIGVITAVPAQFLVITTAIVPVSGNAQGLRISNMGDHLTLDLGVSNTLRTVSIFSLNGSLQQRVNVPAGETRAVVPGVFAPANGYLFQVK